MPAHTCAKKTDKRAKPSAGAASGMPAHTCAKKTEKRAKPSAGARANSAMAPAAPDTPATWASMSDIVATPVPSKPVTSKPLMAGPISRFASGETSDTSPNTGKVNGSVAHWATNVMDSR